MDVPDAGVAEAVRLVAGAQVLPDRDVGLPVVGQGNGFPVGKDECGFGFAGMDVGESDCRGACRSMRL